MTCPRHSDRACALLLSRSCDRVLLSRSCRAVAHAHPVAAPACHASVAGTVCSGMPTQLGRWHDLLFPVPRAFSFPPRWPNPAL